MDAIFYGSLTSKTLSLTPGGGAYQFPVFVLGDKGRYRLRLTETIGTSDGQQSEVEVRKHIVEIKLALGRRDQRPTGGTWALSVDGVEAAAISYDVTAANAASALQTALNALANVGTGQDYGDATVTVANGSWEIIFAGATEAVPLTAHLNALRPVSGVHISAADRGDGVWVHTVRLRQMPVALATSLSTVAQQAPVPFAIRDGYTDEDSAAQIPEEQGFTIDPSFQGIYAFKRGERQTPALRVANTSAQVQDALNTYLADAGGRFEVSVLSDNVGRITYLGDMAGIDQDLIEVVTLHAPPADSAIIWSMNARECHQFLYASATGTEDMILEVQVRYKDKSTDADAAIRQCTFPVEVQLTGEVIADDITSLAPLNYGTPHLYRDYLPFDPAQIQAGILNYPFTFGSQLATVVTHGLETEALFIMVRENEPDGARLIEGTDYRVAIDDDQQITITLLGDYASPLPGADALAGVVLGAEQQSFFNAHTHTRAQVPEVDAALTDFGARLLLVENALGTFRVGTVSAEAGAAYSWPLEPVFLALRSGVPAGFEVPTTLAGFDPAAARIGFRRLTGAVHDAATESLPSPLPDSGTVGSVYTATAADANFPGGGIRVGDHAIWDGNRWLRVERHQAKGVVFTANASTDKLSTLAHGLTAGDRITFTTSAADLPAPLAVGTVYYVRDVEADAFKVATSSGGSAVNLTDAGTGVHLWHRQRDSYYPAEMAGDAARLFMVQILPEELILGSSVSIQIGFEAMLAVDGRRPRDRRSEGRYRFLIESGIAQAATTPGSPGPNEVAIDWTILLAAEFSLTTQPRAHRYGLTVTRAATTGTLTARQLIERLESATLAPNGGVGGVPFYLRGRLCDFDLLDSVPEPAGVVLIRGLDVDRNGDTSLALGRVAFS